MSESRVTGKQSPTNLTEFETVNVDPNLPLDQRINEFIRQIKDPDYFRCGKYKIRSNFRKDGPSIEEILISMRR